MRTIHGNDVSVAVDAPPDVRVALQTVGRTEDVRFAPDASRLALAAFARNVVASIAVEIDAGPSFRLTGFEELRSSRFDEPHGVEFLDPATMVIANRGGDLELVRLDRRVTGDPSTATSPWLRQRTRIVDEPSLVRLARVGSDVDLVVGSNGGAEILVHRIELREPGPPGIGPDGEHTGLIGEPDGVAISPDGRWLAVSAHGMRAIFVYDRRTPITPAIAPRAILRGPVYPHGVCFTPDGEMILVADAGRPMAHAFARRGETWSGIRHTDLAIRVMDDDTYLRGHVNPQEGGPKGIDVDPTGRVVVTTCRHLPLAAFDVGAIRAVCSDTPADEDEGVAAELVLIEDAWRELHRARVALSSLRRSRVMRATAPLRSFYRRLSGKA